MRILHVPFCYYPDPVGGTEVYVEALADRQRKQGIQAAVAAPASVDSAYQHNGISVHRFKANDPAPDVRDLYGEGDRSAIDSFMAVLKRASPDVVHLHAFTSGTSLRLVRSIRAQGIPVVFTYHTPTASCARGTLLRWGREICDGIVDVHRCTRCALDGQGLGRPLSVLLGSIPPGIGRWIGDRGLAGGFWTAARMTELIALRRDAFYAFLGEVDHIIAVCEWVKDLLLANGAAAGKITLCRQGLAAEAPPLEVALHTPPPVRLAFLGRLHGVKGVDVLVNAIRLLPDLPLELGVYGVVQHDQARQMVEELTSRLGRDRRVRFLPPVPAADVVRTLRSYDCLAVPSQWLESGPLVVYEAFAAGIPVIGSHLGGIAELVEHERNGLLVEAGSAEAWAGALRRLCAEPELLPRLRAGIGPVRTMDAAAREMTPIYRAIAARSQAAGLRAGVVQ